MVLNGMHRAKVTEVDLDKRVGKVTLPLLDDAVSPYLPVLQPFFSIPEDMDIQFLIEVNTDVVVQFFGSISNGVIIGKVGGGA